MSPEFLQLLGGSALLIYSVEEISGNIQYLFGPKLKSWINLFAQNRLSAIILGIILSFFLSSSGAVTLMLVGLANARLLTLEQVFSVTLGDDVGTTFSVQLFAFKVSQYGLLILSIGVFQSSFAKTGRGYQIGRSLLFFGMMFFAMDIIMQSGKGLENNELFNYLMQYFESKPVISFLFAAVLTAAVQSSAATIALLMSLMSAKSQSLNLAIPWVLGANLGTTATAFLGSFKSGVLGKQAALGNLLCKVFGIILVIPFITYFTQGVEWLGGDIRRQIANAHTAINLLIAIAFFPFISWGVSLARRWIPENKESGPFHFKYLDPKSLETPELALAQAQREILRLADVVENMVARCIQLFQDGDSKELENIKAMDSIADYLNRGIKMFLTQLSQSEMNHEQVQREFELLLRTNDLENIGDIIDKNILELARKKIKKSYNFSKEGMSEIVVFHKKILECLQLSTAYFSTKDLALVSKLKLLKQQIDDLMIDLSEQHVQRLHKGVKESMETTSVHLDLLGNLQRIADLSTNILRMQGHRQDALQQESEYEQTKNWNP